MDTKNYELLQLTRILQLPDGKERDEGLVILFFRISARIIPFRRWNACGAAPKLLHDARMLAVENMYFFAKRNGLEPTRSTLKALVVITQRAAAATICAERKHMRRVVIPVLGEEIDDPVGFLMDRTSAAERDGIIEADLTNKILLEELISSPSKQVTMRIAAILLLRTPLWQALPTQVKINDIMEALHAELILMANKSYGISAEAISTFMTNVKNWLPNGISQKKLKNFVYNHSRRNQVPEEISRIV